MSRTSHTRLSSNSGEDSNVKKDHGEFTFSNGDTYTGGFIILKDKRFLSRHGQGTYVTGDFNKYQAYWIEDRIIGEVNICHNNGTVYKGTSGIDGGMSGFGTYTFIDTSVLEANWDQNKPVADIILKEPLGSVWKGVYDGKEVAFTAANHFWDEIRPLIEDAEEEEVEEEKEEEEGEKHLDDFEP